MYVCEHPKSKVNALSIMMHIVPLLYKSNLWWMQTTPIFDYLRAFTMVVLKNLTFSNSENYFIYFKTLLYNIPNIKSSIFLPLHLNIFFIISLFFLNVSFTLFLSFSLSSLKHEQVNNQLTHTSFFSTHQTHTNTHRQPPPPPPLPPITPTNWNP